MHFEVHITVAESQSKKFRECCDKEGWKALRINLVGKGLKYPIHTMCAIRFDGNLAFGLIHAGELYGKVSNDFKIERMKLEIPYFQRIDGAVYHEVHVKASKFDDTFKYANSINEWGDRKALLTCRSKTELPTQDAFENYGVIDYEAESVLIDTNPDLDAGWCEI
jgi:hypothetical protein